MMLFYISLGAFVTPTLRCNVKNFLKIQVKRGDLGPPSKSAAGAVVLTTLLYGSETWTAYRRHEKQLNHFHLRCLRNLLHIRWQDKVPDTEVLKQANFPSIITTMRKAQLRWAGHVSRMPDDRIPKQLLYGELCHGKRKVGGQRKRFKDSLKVSLKDFNISTESWESRASDRHR